ncbi:MAG: tRNA (adenosine(37)-N6)-threonylcarbamoyltransferase complex dimerization subunit type 1 TsaB [Rickettsiales bacterium]|jgi:tRNA threonylcarbamoyl adenosine modification protein YeaZ|nr:tRNA (adenosine(37)-N6)-threonylcarbamoyltransferase complex dimerization subunit type 1 TsaB [Rickettsiales bacterium]
MILVINTVYPGLIQLCDDTGGLVSVKTDSQSTDLPGAVKKFCGDFSKISKIGVITGPGSFTGIRLGIAYAKGLALGCGVPIVGVNAFQVYLAKNPDAFVAIDSGRGDFFVGARDIAPTIMTIDAVEAQQFDYPKTVGHAPFDLTDAVAIVRESNECELVIPLYIKPSYAETNRKSS